MGRKDTAHIDRYRQVRNLPTPVMNGMYEMCVRAFERGFPKPSHPIILRGMLMQPLDDGSWKMHARGVQCWVRWYLGNLPTDVRAGRRYTIMGDLLTANQGDKFVIVDCVIIPSHQAFMDEFDALIGKHVLNINTYMQKPERDTFFVE